MRASKAVVAPENERELAQLYETDPIYVNRKITYKADKKTIGEALKGGLEISGCALEEHYSLVAR